MLNNLKAFLQKYHRVLFYSSWLIIHLVQAATTELFDDEAYYWIYSVFPDWGYFDHPPMIAMLIKTGYAIFHNELGVRLLTIFLSTASIYLVDSLIEKKDPLLFYAICASLALAQIGGMMAVPDTPLMFFVALFFWLYRRFINKMNLANTILLGISIALMLYTKYHGVLVVIFTGLSNLKLLKHYQTYVATLIAIILFIPHVYWQHLHGYPSVQFHLFERNAVGYEVSFTIEYILGQIILAGPLMGWLLILAALKYKPSSPSERALKFTFIGVYVFFLISTLKGKAEANWTIPSFIGMIVLSHQYLLTHGKWRKWLFYSVPATLVLVFAARILMMVDMPPAWWLAKDEFHQNKIWVNAIKQRAGDKPVVIIDTYQKPSKFRFYSGGTSMALNTPNYRRNNYNFWNIEDSLIGKTVSVTGPSSNILFDTFPSAYLKGYGSGEIKLYYSFSRVLINNIESNATDGQQLSVKFQTNTPRSYLAYFQQAPYDTASIYLAIYSKKKVVAYLPSNIQVKNINKQSQQCSAHFKLAGLPPGNYSAKFSISSCIPYQPSLNSSGFAIKLK